MSDERLRDHERKTDPTDLERARLGAERCRRGCCPWCGVPQDLERNDGCCCFACFESENRAGRRRGGENCAACPIRPADDEPYDPGPPDDYL
jgi:hypothetical protein